jgi:ABC-type polysaccharide/polyol phosphate export permease
MAVRDPFTKLADRARTSKLHEITSRRELFLNLTLRELRGKYKRSALGWAWSLLNPLVTMATYSLVFSYFLRVDPEVGNPSGLENFALFLMCGLLPFNFLSNSMSGGMSSLIGNSNLVKKVYFPREVLVAAIVTSWLVSFLIELGLLSVALLIAGNMVLPWLPLVLLVVALQTMFVLGIALMMAVATVYYRDLEHLVGLALQVWLYSTPIIYPLAFVADKLPEGSWGWTIYNLNPLVRFVGVYRDLLYSLRWPSAADMVFLTGVSVAMLAAGYMVFNWLEGRLAEEL